MQSSFKMAEGVLSRIGGVLSKPDRFFRKPPPNPFLTLTPAPGLGELIFRTFVVLLLSGSRRSRSLCRADDGNTSHEIVIAFWCRHEFLV